jgi:hypothetical protein
MSKNLSQKYMSRMLTKKRRRKEVKLLAGSVGRYSSHRGSKPGYQHAEHPAGSKNVTKAITRPRRTLGKRAELVGALGRAPGKIPGTAVYKKDARRRREAALARQEVASVQAESE